jgi:hypothetical protein
MVLIEVGMNRKQAKFIVPFKRTANWWRSDWAEISGWCLFNLGRDNWDYMHEEFWFIEEKHMMWFKLRWS